MRLVWFSILLALSAKGIFISAPLFSPVPLLWLALFLFLTGTLVVRWIKIRPPTPAMEVEGMVLSLLLVNSLTQQTGALNSSFNFLYILLILFFSFYFSFFKNIVGVVLVLFMEGMNFYFFPPAGHLPAGAALFPMALILIPVIVKGYLRSFHRERKALRSVVNRMKSGAASLEPSPEIHEKANLSNLSEKEKQDEALALTMKMEGHLENILEVILASRSQVYRAAVLLYDPEGERLWLRAAAGRERPVAVDWEKSIAIGEGVVGWIAKEKRLVSIADLQSQRGKLDYEAGTVRARSLLAAPILNGEVFEGLLCVDSPSDHAFSDADERLIQLIAQEALTVLQYYREQRRMKDRTREYSALLEISKNLGSKLDLAHRLETTIASAKAIIDYDQCFIFLVNEGERRMTVAAARGYEPPADYGFPLTNGFLSLIVKNRQPLLYSKLFSAKGRPKIFPDGYEIDISSNSFLGLPMMIEEKVIGVVFFSSEKENAFSASDQHILAIMCNHVAASIAEAQAHAKVKKLAITDGLTGVFNHRRFQERLLEEFYRVSRHPEPFSLLLIDIDFFKKINDTYGHPAGDAVIKMIAKVLLKLVRKLDIVARYGGEEFVILLLKSDSRQALQMAERIRKAVEGSPFDWQGQKIYATISVGVASQPDDTVKKEELIAFADRALYASKHAGRNRSTLYRDLTQDLYELG